MLYFDGESHEYILFLDVEFDQMKLIQFAGLLFRKVDDGYYKLFRSLNSYVRGPIGASFEYYTNLSQDFLIKNGVMLSDVKAQITEDLLWNVGNDILLVSHGIKGDLNVLEANGIIIPHAATYCTFEKAKTVLNRKTKISLEDICFECGVYPTGQHNAFIDSWLTVAVFSYLKDME